MKNGDEKLPSEKDDVKDRKVERKEGETTNQGLAKDSPKRY
jgi:hypothetical protein